MGRAACICWEKGRLICESRMEGGCGQLVEASKGFARDFKAGGAWERGGVLLGNDERSFCCMFLKGEKEYYIARFCCQ